MDRHVLIVTGMHRSGTSLVADLVQRAGMFIGDRLLGPAVGNPRGHFEDRDFYELHERCLARQGRDFLLESTSGLAGFDAAEQVEATRLIDARRARRFWGWKDPRTTLFLADWDRLLPDARYLFVYRHPLEVVLSLLRRATDLQIAADPWRGLRAWEAYNGAIVAFVRTAGVRCVVAPLADVVADPDAWIGVVAERLALPLVAGSLGTAVTADLTVLGSASEAAALRDLAPSAMALYDELNRLAADARPAAAGTPPSPAPRRDGSPTLPHLLAALDAPAVLASRDALDAFRRTTIAELEDLVRGQAAEIDDVRGESERTATRIAALERRVEELVAGTRALEESLARQAAELATWERASVVTSAVRRVIRGGQRAWRGHTNGRAAVRTTPPGATAGASDTVVFVSHDAHRHGAQLLLLHLLQWIAANTRLPFEIVLAGDGELRDDFMAVAPTHRWPAALQTSEVLRDPARVGLVYANTITLGGVLPGLSHLACPVVTHVHELGHWIAHRVDPGELRQVFARTSHYVAVSQAVRDVLVDDFRLARERIDLVHEFVHPDALVVPDPGRVRELRRGLGIPDDAVVVGGSGTMDWRKGPDLFVQLAAMVRRRMKEGAVHFVWVGGARSGYPYEQLAHDARVAGVGDAVHLVGSVTDPTAYFALFDAFALVSREDPFPLVALEAAAQGAPIVCFDGAGGAPELVGQGCGLAVPYLDVEAMAERLAALLRAPAERRALGARGRTLVRERYTVDVQGPKVMAVIQRLMDAGTPARVPR